MATNSAGLSGSAATPKPSRAAKRGCVGLLRGDRHDRASGCENSVHFAGHDDAFQASLDGDHVGVGCGQHRRDLVRREKGQKAHIRRAGGRCFQASALGSVADEDKTYAVVFEFARCREQRLPRAVKSQIARVQQDEAEVRSESR